MVDLSREFFKLAWKYGIPTLRSNRKAKQLIREFYSLNYPDKESEMQVMLRHNSRAAASIGLLSLAIYVANRGEKNKNSSEARDITAWQMNIGGVASIADVFHDEILIPYIVQQEELSVNRICNLINDYEKVYQLASTLDPVHSSETGELLIPTDLAGASMRVEKTYSQEIKKRNKDAYLTYVNGKNAVQKVQAKDIGIAIALRKENVDEALHIIGSGNYLERLSELHDKLGIVGSESAVIINQLTWTDKKIEINEVNQVLREAFGSLTKINQAGYDDLKNIVDDVNKKSPNIFMLSMLPEYQEITIENLRKFLSENPKIVSDIFTPLIDANFASLEKLEGLDFAYEDYKLGFAWSMKRIRKCMEHFKRELRVDIDESWLNVDKL